MKVLRRESIQMLMQKRSRYNSYFTWVHQDAKASNRHRTGIMQSYIALA